MTINPIEQFTQARTALLALRQSLMDQVQTIDTTLGTSPSKAAPKPAKEPNSAKAPKAGGTKETVLQAVTAGPMTLKEIVTALPQYPAKSLESVVYALASAGKLAKDGSKPAKFSAAVGAV